MAIGRPTDYSEELADEICERIADGESLRSICRDEDKPSKSTVCRWLTVHQSFQDQYAKAREAQADAIFDEMLDIADDASNDWMERRDADGEAIGWQINGDHVQRTRLRLDTRKWMAGKLRPKKYGEKIVNEHSGPDGGPIETKADPRDLAKAIAVVLSKGLDGSA